MSRSLAVASGEETASRLAVQGMCAGPSGARRAGALGPDAAVAPAPLAPFCPLVELGGDEDCGSAPGAELEQPRSGDNVSWLNKRPRRLGDALCIAAKKLCIGLNVEELPHTLVLQDARLGQQRVQPDFQLAATCLNELGILWWRKKNRKQM